MSPKIKEELLKIALAMREARRYERKQKALARNAGQESSETTDEEDTLERAAREWAEAQRRIHVWKTSVRKRQPIRGQHRR